MARNNPKPSEKLDWIPDDTTNILEPLPSVKATGWLFGQKPPNNSFNFITNLINRLLDYAMGQVEDWIVIDSDADEGDYATLVAYIADAPAAGDRILVKEDQTITAQFVLPDNVTLKFLDGSRLLCATNIATSVLQFGSDIIVEGVLNIVLSQTGITAKAVELNGDNVTGKINVENSSTGTLTTAHHINASKTGNKIDGFAQNTGGGTLTNVIVDNSTEDSNVLTIIDEPNNQARRSRGAYTFIEGRQLVRMYRNSQQSIPVAASTLIQFNATKFDPDNLWDGINHRFVPTIPGYYYIFGTITLAGIDSTKRLIIYTRKNITIINEQTFTNDSAGAHDLQAPFHALEFLDGVTDYFEIRAFHDSALAKNTTIQEQSINVSVFKVF